jgi:hypothetical protein
VDEARKVIRRLDRIEALKRARAPADELLAEVRELLSEGEAWIAAERDEAGRPEGEALASEGGPATDGAAAALAGCRRTLANGRKVKPETAETAPL